MQNIVNDMYYIRLLHECIVIRDTFLLYQMLN